MANKPPAKQPRPFILIGILTVVLVLGGFLVWSNIQPAPLDDEVVEYRLKWLANPGFAGDLYSDAYGVFREQGLNVRVEPGGPERDSMVALASGQAQFAVASADQVLRAIYGGADAVVVAQIYQTDPVQWIYRNDTITLSEAGDLVGRRIGVTIGDNDETIMRTFLAINDVGEDQVDLIPVRFDFSPFLNKTVDMFPIYINTQGVELSRMLAQNDERAGFFQALSPNPAGIVPNSIVTTSRVLREEPQLVCRFTHAALTGWEMAGNPDERDRTIRAVRFAQRGVRESELPREERESLRDQVTATADLVRLRYGEAVLIGSIDVDRWIATEELMLSAGIFDSDGVRPTRIGIQAHLEGEFVDRHHDDRDNPCAGL